MSEATHEGAEQSIHERLMARLEEPQPEEVEKVEEEVQEETPEETHEPEVEDDSGEEVAEEDATDEEEGPSVQLSDLSQYLGIDEDRLGVDDEGNVYVKTKIDGEEGRAKFADLIKSYQLEGHLNKQNMEVAEQKKQLQQKMAELESTQQAKLQQLEDLTQLAWNQLTQEYQSIDWQKLREEDPAEYAARSQDFNRRQAELNQAYLQIQSQREQFAIQQQEALQQTLLEEGAKLISAIPEWKDESVANKEREEIRSFAKSLGFSEQELNQVVDHRHVLILRDAMKYRQLQKSKAEVSKKVMKAPKLVKPGQAQSQKDRDSRKIQDLRKSIKKTGGKRGSVAEYLLATGKV